MKKAETSDPAAFLAGMAGSWEGTCRTWFHPGQLADESEVQGRFEPVLNGRFLRHTYTSGMKGKPRAGEELIAYNPAQKQFQVTWMDDFHMNYGILFSEGEPTSHGFSVTGAYAVGPGHPRWGWRTVYELSGPDRLTITAYNVSPEGEESKAVETVYRRVK